MLLIIIAVAIVVVLSAFYLAVCMGILVIPPLGPRTKTKVFVIGLSRTGTTSIAVALHRLGYKTYHAMFKMAKYPTMGESGQSKAVKRWVDAFDAFSDLPVMTVYQELAVMYPDAKFVLTSRGADRWAEAMLRFMPGMRNVPNNTLLPAGDLFRASYGDNWRDLGRDDWHGIYLAHQKEVREFFADKPGRLLEMNIPGGEGWRELCGFLGVDAPVDEPFPHADVYKLTFGTQFFWEIGNLLARLGLGRKR